MRKKTTFTRKLLYGILIGTGLYLVVGLALTLAQRRLLYYLRSYHGALAVLLGGRDDVIPNNFGRKLYDEYHGRKKLCEMADAGHDDLPQLKPEFFRELLEFWNKSLLSESSAH